MATNRFFTVMPRNIQIQYFEEDPIIVEKRINDENDKIMRDSLTAGDKAPVGDYAKREKIFCNMVGESEAREIIARIDEPDCFVLEQLISYTFRTYTENRQKNLNAAATGKTK